MAAAEKSSGQVALDDSEEVDQGQPLRRSNSQGNYTPAPSKGGNTKQGGLQLSRQMTTHVVTRWYRAPELMLKMAR